MKKFILFTLFFLSLFLTHATTHIITVSNYQFTPSSVNANVGDTVKWVWQSGFHTTTSTSVPGGAAAWNAPMEPTSEPFFYVLSVAGNYNYWCTPHSGFMTGTLTVSAVLPVTLTAFSVVPNGNAALLKWTTASEINTASYIIKRSNDGSHFTEVGRVAAAGNSATQKTYSFIDKTIPGSNRFLYYYIDIQDKDGAHTLSGIQPFKNVFSSNKLIRQVSPNPLSGTCHLMLQFNADKNGEMLAQVFSFNGKLLKEDKLAAVEGVNNGHICVGALSAGTYILVCTLDGKKETRQILVQ